MPAKEKIPAATQAYYDQIIAVTDAICREHLNEEYAEICCSEKSTPPRRRQRGGR